MPARKDHTYLYTILFIAVCVLLAFGAYLSRNPPRELHPVASSAPIEQSSYEYPTSSCVDDVERWSFCKDI